MYRGGHVVGQVLVKITLAVNHAHILSRRWLAAQAQKTETNTSTEMYSLNLCRSNLSFLYLYWELPQLYTSAHDDQRSCTHDCAGRRALAANRACRSAGNRVRF